MMEVYNDTKYKITKEKRTYTLYLYYPLKDEWVQLNQAKSLKAIIDHLLTYKTSVLRDQGSRQAYSNMLKLTREEKIKLFIQQIEWMDKAYEAFKRDIKEHKEELKESKKFNYHKIKQYADRFTELLDKFRKEDWKDD